MRTHLLRAIVITCALLATTPIWAARDFTPQTGSWVVSSELNGKPGRGLAIDVQGNTFFMQVFGYEAEDVGTVQFTLTYVGATITRPSSVQFPHEEASTMQRLVLEEEN
jgi:hypothetical protein